LSFPRIANVEDNDALLLPNTTALKHSEFVGVGWGHTAGEWFSCCRVQGERRHIGYFGDDEFMAAAAYDAYVRRHSIGGPRNFNDNGATDWTCKDGDGDDAKDDGGWCEFSDDSVVEHYYTTEDAGETLLKISNKLRVKPGRLLELNFHRYPGIKLKSVLYRGTVYIKHLCLFL